MEQLMGTIKSSSYVSSLVQWFPESSRPSVWGGVGWGGGGRMGWGRMGWGGWRRQLVPGYG